jgi:DNA polymerase
MTHDDREDRREAVATLLDSTWTLFDDAQKYLDPSYEGSAPPDFSQRVMELVPNAQQEAASLLERSTLAQIAGMVRTCDRCPLHATRRNAVPGEGKPNARLMVIGEGPGADEDASGRPFVGRAGKYLDAWLQAINLDRVNDVFIGNVVKCRPPENRDPYPEEAASCIPFLTRQIALVKPDAILCVGKVAAHHLLQRDDALRAMRSTVHRFAGIPVVVTYHPAAVLRNLQLRAPVWEDLKRVAQLIGVPVNRSGR